MECILNCEIEQCEQAPPIVCADASIIEAGQVEAVGTPGAGTYELMHVAAAAADGVTQRAVDIAAGIPARPDRYAPLIRIPDCTVQKMAADDSIAVGAQLFFSVDDNVFVSALSKVDNSGVCYQCAVAIELSDDPADTIRAHFDGIGVVGEAGTA